MWTPPKRLRSGRAAFTLIEMIAVMAILAIVAAMVVPYAADADSMQSMAAARRLVADLEYAQSLAVTAQDPVTVTFSESGETYTLSNTSGTVRHPIQKKDFTVDFTSAGDFQRVDLYAASFGGNKSVTFDELGAPDAGGYVLLKAGPHLYRIEVAVATGAVRIDR